MFYFTTPAFHLKVIFVIEPLWIACIGPPLSIPIKCIVSKHSAFQHAHTLFSISLALSLSVVCTCTLSFRWLALETLLQQQSPLARVAMFAVVITVFMGASRSALAFIYDSQKGHKRGERGWSLWLPLSAIVRPCLAHPLLRAGIPSLITGHPPRCRSNVAIKAVWESGAFVQLECSAINRLRPKVINCVTKEARATTGRGRIGKSFCSLAASTSFERLFPPSLVHPPRISGV